MDFKILKTNQRYMFYDKLNKKYFRATFIDIIRNTLRVTKYEYNGIHDVSLMLTMPLDWIGKIDTLETILDNPILPSDIYIQIDLFL
jgi:hypothetical protein